MGTDSEGIDGMDTIGPVSGETEEIDAEVKLSKGCPEDVK